MADDSTPTLSEVLDRAIRTRLAGLRVGLPARVESYDAAKHKASVQPLILEGYEGEDGERAVERLPVINDVPVIFPGSGGTRVKFPIAKGDTVFLTFASSSLDRWLVTGGEVDPADERRHDLSDAVAIPGLMDFAHVSDHTPMIEFTATEIRAGGTQALVTKTEFDNHVHLCPAGTSGSPTVPATGTTYLRGFITVGVLVALNLLLAAYLLGRMGV